MGAKITFDISGFDNNLSAGISKLGAASKKIVESTTDKIYIESQAEVPIETGSLMRSGKKRISSSLLKTTGIVTYGAEGQVNTRTGKLVSSYQLIVHEDLAATHLRGKAKFLEDPVRRAKLTMKESTIDIISRIFNK